MTALARCGRLSPVPGPHWSLAAQHWTLIGPSSPVARPCSRVWLSLYAFWRRPGIWLPACSARLTSLVGKWRKLTRDWRVWWKLSPDCSCPPARPLPGPWSPHWCRHGPLLSASRSVLILAEIWLNMNKICSGPHQAGITPGARTPHQHRADHTRK